jgi:ribonuclease E
VEPSLQAAFVDYGGNRHGFLAFSEIHPDYYQIPVVDRQALIDEDARAQRDEDEEDNRSPRRSRRHRRGDQEMRAEKRRTSEDDEGIAELDAGESDSEQTRADGAFPEQIDHEPFEDETATIDRDRVENFGEREASDDTERSAPAQIHASSQASPQASPNDQDANVERPFEEPIAGWDEQDPDAATLHSETNENSPDPVEDNKPDLGHEHRLATDPEGFAVVAEMDEASEETEFSDQDVEARFRPERKGDANEDIEDEADQVEQLGGDAMEEVPTRPHRYRKQYKIQEVIKRRQVLLVQVVKEERGNKGAALTTYLSLAGRYSVLMPNTARGGGISRKITDAGDRQRLKSIAQELEVPEGMGVILRTAGAARTKAEVKRDFEYLLRMWETVREMTLKSTAPTLVYEEGSLIKRAIRDLYNKDIDEVIVAGENGYREAKEFMRMLMPSHAKNVQPYRDAHPVFAKSGVEAQLDAMFSNQVTLKSGGYIVINQTEALVAIDVNSGRSTREHNIEDTALRTNLEAADEVARQLRLRDLAGLIVVDFIDMEEGRNNRAVERRLKDALKNDRARIQVGRISHFGLLEMSRQRMRTGVLEGSTVICSHCAGAGMVRSTSSIALHVLRLLEDALIKSATHNICVRTRTVVALYILNQKRTHLRELEERYGVTVTVVADDTLTGTAYHAMERGEPATSASPSVNGSELLPRQEVSRVEPTRPADFFMDIKDEDEAEGEGDDEISLEAGEAGGETQAGDKEQGDADGSRRRRRRRRRRGRGGDREGSGIAANAPQPSDDALAIVAEFGGIGSVGGSTNGSDQSAEAWQEAGLTREENHTYRSDDPSHAWSAFDQSVETLPNAASAHHSEHGEPVQIGGPIPEANETAVTGPARQRRRAPRSRSPRRDEIYESTMSPLTTEQENLPLIVDTQDELTKTDEAPVLTFNSDADHSSDQSVGYSDSSLADSSFADRNGAERNGTETTIETSEESSPVSAPEPDRPKRSGWWQRAKATLRG